MSIYFIYYCEEERRKIIVKEFFVLFSDTFNDDFDGKIFLKWFRPSMCDGPSSAGALDGDRLVVGSNWWLCFWWFDLLKRLREKASERESEKRRKLQIRVNPMWKGAAKRSSSKQVKEIQFLIFEKKLFLFERNNNYNQQLQQNWQVVRRGGRTWTWVAKKLIMTEHSLPK